MHARSDRWNLVALACLAIPLLGIGPCGPIPGGALPETTVTVPVRDWSFANDVRTCAVEVGAEDPKSVTVNCMSWQKRLFVSCSVCATKRWASVVPDEPRGRVRVGDDVYPVTFRRLTDPAELDAVWAARAAKLDDDPSERPEAWWSFELVSRASGRG